MWRIWENEKTFSGRFWIDRAAPNAILQGSDGYVSAQSVTKKSGLPE